MTTLGQALADTLHDFGIGGYIFGCEADAEQITVWRSVQTSDGESVAMFEDPVTGLINGVARVAETFDLDRVRR